MSGLIAVPAEVNADFVVVGRDGRPALLVEIRALAAGPSLSEETAQFLKDDPSSCPFGMVVNRTVTSLFASANPERIVHDWFTADLLRHYDPEYAKTPVYLFYLSALVKDWLEDLCSHWNSPHPPGHDRLEESGLLDRLEGGEVRSVGALK